MEPTMTSEVPATLQARLRIAGILSIAGLTVEMVTCFWVHPLAFLSFLFIGCGLLGLGIFLFLWTLLIARAQ